MRILMNIVIAHHRQFQCGVGIRILGDRPAPNTWTGMKFHNLLVVLSLAIFYFACSDDSPVLPVQQPEERQLGAVSGIITDANTENPIPGVMVTLLDQTVEVDVMEVGVNGRYVFTEIPHSEMLNLIVKAADYETHTRTFALNVEHLVLSISLKPLTDPEAEIRQFLDTLSALIESIDAENLEEIQAHFSEVYLASDDPVTRVGLGTGVIPGNFEKVIPSITKLFETFNGIQFNFNDIQVDITHTRKVSAQLNLDVITEKGPRPDRQQVTAECEIHFRKEESDWKAVFWKLFTVDIHL